MVKRRRGSRTARRLAPRLRAVIDDSRTSSTRPSRGSRCRSPRPSTRSPSSSTTSRRADQLRESDIAGRGTLYGLYEGVARTEYGADWVVVPNRITLFRLPLEADFPDPDDLADEVWVTVVHELAHHLGIDDDRLDDLGVVG